jgi:hypothetical protein
MAKRSLAKYPDVFLFVLTLFGLSLPVLWLFGMHLRLIAHGKTTNEMIKANWNYEPISAKDAWKIITIKLFGPVVPSFMGLTK